MKKILFTLICILSLNSCDFSYGTYDDLYYSNLNPTIDIIFSYGTPYYYGNIISYYYWNGYYYYPYYKNNFWYYHRYPRPLPHPKNNYQTPRRGVPKYQFRNSDKHHLDQNRGHFNNQLIITKDYKNNNPKSNILNRGIIQRRFQNNIKQQKQNYQNNRTFIPRFGAGGFRNKKSK